jgi:WD40 repeat protein
LAAAGLGSAIRVWRVDTGVDTRVGAEAARDLLGHQDQVRALAFSPDSQMLATASFDRTVRLWSLSSGLLLSIFRHQGSVMDCAFSHSGAQIASASDDRLVRVWSVPRHSSIPDQPAEVARWMQNASTVEVNDATYAEERHEEATSGSR